MSSAVGVVPVDAASRERVRDDHDISLLIEAGAGTGKTTALVDRIVALVAAGDASLREVAAITFTEAAASELRDRIRSRLELAAAGAIEWVPDGPPRARCRDALAEIDDAALTTLHGFAQRLLTEHPLEAGLPPVFEVLDEIRARVRFDQRWAELVEQIFADEALEEVLLTGLTLGFRFDHLRSAARLLHDNHDRVPPASPIEPLPALDVRGVVAALDDVLALRGACRNDDDTLAVHIDESIRTLRDRLVMAPERLDVLEVLAQPWKLTCGNKGKMKSWGCPKADVVAACERAQERYEHAVNGQRNAVLSALVHHVVEFVRADARTRAEEGTLEFHDLLVLARDLLRTRPEVRESAAHRWQRLFLDEFQDTDPLQIELAVLITSAVADAGSRDWRDVPISAGRLAVVGDPQQSIYRFRRADLRVYDDVRRSLELEDARLVENFRSVPDIIDAVNAVFAALFADPEAGVQATHVELHAHRPPLDDWTASVAVFGDAVDDRVAIIRDREARDIAAILQSIKHDEWPVVGADGTMRPAAYSDVAILIPSRTVLPAIEEALEHAGIPARVESQSLVFATAEIRDLVSILSAVDDPTDAISVVAALRSSAFGCTDAELARYALAGGRWDYRVAARGAHAGVPDDHPVLEGLRALHGFWDQRWWRSVSQIAEAVVRERSLLEVAVARRRPRDHWRRIRWFLDQARAWDDAGGSTLRGFVEWAREQAEERARVTESIAPEPDDDAVRILTVHGAKGLEFPVVLLAGLSTQPPVFNPPVVWDVAGDPEYRVGTASARAQTPGYETALAAERRHDEAERLRLLYVAMTRARDHLVVSLRHKAGKKCHANSVAAALEATGPRRLEPAAPEPAAPRAPGAAPAAEPAAYERWDAERTTALTDAARPLSVAATTIAALADAADPGLAKEPPDDLAPRWRRGRAGTAIGRAVHSVLQTIDLAGSTDLAATARAQAFAEGVADRTEEVRALAEAATRAPVVQEALAARHRWWREVPVAAEIDGTVLEGFIDLLVETDDGLVVVDYKTDHVSDADLDDVLDHYAVQGAAYAVALEAALAQPVTRCVFVFARTDGPLEREVTDLDAAKADVRRRLGVFRRQ